MAKLILLWIIFFSVFVPIWVSTKPSPARAIRKIHIQMAIAVIIWALLCISWYPKLVPVD